MPRRRRSKKSWEQQGFQQRLQFVAPTASLIQMSWNYFKYIQPRVCANPRIWIIHPDTNEMKWNEMKWNEGGLKLTDVLLWPITRAFRDLRSTPPVWLAIPFGGAKLDSRDAKAKCKPECWSPNSASIAARITSKACSTDSLVPPFMRSWSWWDLRCVFLFFFCSTCTWIWIWMFNFFVFSLSVYFNLIL